MEKPAICMLTAEQKAMKPLLRIEEFKNTERTGAR